MAELVAIGFDNPSDADAALAELRRLQREYLIDLEDAVVAVRDSAGEVQLKQSVNLVGAGAASGGLWGGLWGSLVGMLFLNPLAGFALGSMVGAGTGALSGKLADYGIDDDFIRSIAQTMQPGTSGLFVLVRKVQPEKVLAELSRFKGRVLRSSLSPEQEARLQAALSHAAGQAQPMAAALRPGAQAGGPADLGSPGGASGPSGPSGPQVASPDQPGSLTGQQGGMAGLP